MRTLILILLAPIFLMGCYSAKEFTPYRYADGYVSDGHVEGFTTLNMQAQRVNKQTYKPALTDEEVARLNQETVAIQKEAGEKPTGLTQAEIAKLQKPVVIERQHEVAVQPGLWGKIIDWFKWGTTAGIAAVGLHNQATGDVNNNVSNNSGSNAVGTGGSSNSTAIGLGGAGGNASAAASSQ